MKIGHIYLNGKESGCSEHFIRLIEGIDLQGFEQHIIVGNHELASRVSVCSGVTAGHTTNNAVMAMVLMPAVSLVHVHDPEGGKAGLLLTLTRSIPYVITHRQGTRIRRATIAHSIYKRAETIIATTPEAAAAVQLSGIKQRVVVIDESGKNGVARRSAEHVRTYRQVVDRSSIPAILL